MPIQVGTEVDRLIPEVVPGGQSIGGTKKGRTNGGAGTPIVPKPIVPYISILLRPNVGDEYTNVSGTPGVLTEMNTINPNFNGKAYSFPSGSGVDNQEEWVNQPIPFNLDTAGLRARVHLLIDSGVSLGTVTMSGVGSMTVTLGHV